MNLSYAQNPMHYDIHSPEFPYHILSEAQPRLFRSCESSPNNSYLRNAWNNFSGHLYEMLTPLETP